MVNKECFYETLGLNKNCSQQDIKKAYRKLAIKWHPDKNQSNKEQATEKFKKISHAYEIISKEETRNLYDKYGHAAFEQGGQNNRGSGFQGFEGFQNFGSFGGFEDMGNFGGFGGFQFRSANDIFKEFFKNDPEFDNFFGQMNTNFVYGGGFQSFGGGFSSGLDGGNFQGTSVQQTTQIINGKRVSTKKSITTNGDGTQTVVEEIINGNQKNVKKYIKDNKGQIKMLN